MKRIPKRSTGSLTAFGNQTSGINFLIGSVIPFLRIKDFKKDFDSKVNEMMQEHELHQRQVQALRLLEQKEDQLHQNISLINEMRKVILYRYCNKCNL